MPDETRRELAACLEMLRWTLAGARAGGVTGWSHAPGQSPLSMPGAAEASLTPPPPAPPAMGGEELLTQPVSGGEELLRDQAGSEWEIDLPAPGGAAGDIDLRAREGSGGEMGFRDRAGGEVHFEERRNAVASARPEEISEEGHIADALDELSSSLSGCSRCRLHSGRTNLVFGEGTTRSGIVFVGEGPGFDEDRQGRPFVGRAGKLLDKMIQAMGYNRSDVYICNVVKCRPPENRTPQPEEIKACSPFLIKQVTALRPKVICALGACASQSLLASIKPISQLRGKIHLWRGIPLVCTYHPAYLLRNPIQKAAAWQDLKEVLRILHSDTS